MLSPLAAQTVLQGRYRLLQLLAESGFARTYLAENQGRFGERCVVKEFCPLSNDATVFEKAQELFQREAKTLYRLAHPQVPRFRASFTEAIDGNQRLFLVQDYVEGQTYRALLRQRLQKGDRFSESEVRHLLSQLLPVLAYIHGQNIIHRDLSLDNLILRTADQKPVLIDFGVVKTVVTQLQQNNILPSGTVVGKFGYAPIEQLQSGRAYPSSDLYSLAVCCLVLLTGLEPSQLFDDTTARWNWRSHITVSDELAAILERMLAHKPSDRYPDAESVLQSFQNLPTTTFSSSPSSPSSPVSSSPPSPDLSQIHTIAVNSPPKQQENRASKPNIPPIKSPSIKSPKVISPEDSARSSHSGWLVLVSLATAAVVSAGLGWVVMQFLTLHPWSKGPVLVSPSPSPTQPQPKPTPPTIRYSESLQLEPGQTATVQGNLSAGETQTYRFQAADGDELSARLTGSGVTLSLLRSDLTPLSPETQGISTEWQGTIPRRGTYYARVQNDSAGTTQDFQLTLALSAPPPPPAPSPSPSLTPSPSPSPSELKFEVNETMLNLEAGPTPQQFNGQLAPAQVQRYILPVAAGQALSAAVVDQNQVTLTIRDAAGQPLSSAQNVLTWEALIPEAGNYQIDVVPIDGTKPTNFAIAIGVKQP